MKVVIFAGGLGTRLSEETAIRPKPMVEIGGKPILWHIMKIFAAYGHTDFIVLGGYKVDTIRSWLLNYSRLSSDFTVDLASGGIVWQRTQAEPWKVTVLDTGLETMTGGRLKRARDIIGKGTFFLTYGDGVADVDVGELLAFHKKMGKTCTVTAVQPPGRFGVMGLSSDGDEVTHFREKDSLDVGVINGGFFVCESGVFDVVDADDTVWEQAPMRRLVEKGELACYRHNGFWEAMDTLRDKAVLEAAYQKGAPWIKD
ncbi:MAG: glucose-1-phosphate cytidylyltransferase [Hyphomonadaceae bacterium]|nr:glucose-1-phosphate cytidylyltransferase [Hyphomonadaceae bacterium]